MSGDKLPRFVPKDGVEYHLKVIDVRTQTRGQVQEGWKAASTQYYNDYRSGSARTFLVVLLVDSVEHMWFPKVGHQLMVIIEDKQEHVCLRRFIREEKRHRWFEVK